MSTGSGDDGALPARVAAWIADDVDPRDARTLQSLLDAATGDSASQDSASGDTGSGDTGSEDSATAELRDRFAGSLTFGTAGLRGPLRAGPNGMNRTVVRRAAAGVASWLVDAGRSGGTVVIGFDARHGSAEFAQDSAAVFAAAGFDARLLPAPLPTPVLAYAVGRLHAVAGVMVTASHNPARDNGYKVYDADGAQIAPPTDEMIEAAIGRVGRTRDIPLDTAAVTLLDAAIVDAYVQAVAALASPGPRDLRIVHTAMHGVGAEVAHAVLTAAGFANIRSVAAQQRPDPDFPTVAFPNPEEPGALDLALDLARVHGADLVLANDPDADRCAVAVPLGPAPPSSPASPALAATEATWRMLRGDEVGVLLADELMRRGVPGTYATTIVSSALLGVLTRARGFGYAQTLTGFKWIARAAPDLVFGYEEALGYAVAPSLVRDKDGISAALLVAGLAARLQAQGSSLLDRLDELAAEFGRYATDQVSVRVEDLSAITTIMHRLRADPPATLLGEAVQVDEPGPDILRWRWAGRQPGRVVVRPSGTEPKLKAYLEVVEPGGSATDAEDALGRLRRQVRSLVDPDA